MVEDHPTQREAIRRCLVEKNFDVQIAADYHGAIKVLADCIPDLLCLDMTLPRESGLELCEYIRADDRLRFVPILVISDRSSPEDMANAEDAGANAFLKKPFTRDRLLKYVAVLLDGPHASSPSVRRLRRDK
ncbi:MAG: response regulator [Myxococcota bacterium]|nr:response regulator [Myxococcota bacterium]